MKTADEDTLSLIDLLPNAWPECDGVSSIPAHLRRFVLDGVIEFEWEGRFVSGPEAAMVLGEPDFTPASADRVAALSLEALQYAASLPAMGPKLLASRIYTYNTVPYGPRSKSVFRDTESIAELLGLGPSGGLGGILAAAGYEPLEHAQWHAWMHCSRREGADIENLGFKLYISPRPEAIADASRQAIAALTRSGVVSFKVGRTAQNLLRPDKFVAYCPTENAVRQLARELQPALDGIPAQGVPFTSALTPDGMLSWGSDPPRSLCLAGWAQAESWRAWIANRLAIALLQAKAASRPAAGDAWRFALFKLEAEGVDVRHWTAQPAMWGEEHAAH